MAICVYIKTWGAKVGDVQEQDFFQTEQVANRNIKWEHSRAAWAAAGIHVRSRRRIGLLSQNSNQRRRERKQSSGLSLY